MNLNFLYEDIVVPSKEQKEKAAEKVKKALYVDGEMRVYGEYGKI